MNQKTIEAVYGGKIPKINLGQLRMMRDVRRIIEYLEVICDKMPEDCFGIVMVPIVTSPSANDVLLLFKMLKEYININEKNPWVEPCDATFCSAVINTEALLQKLCTNRRALTTYPRGRFRLAAYEGFRYEEEAYDYDRWFANGFSAALERHFKGRYSLAGYCLKAEHSHIRQIRKCMQEFCFTDLQGPLGYLVSDEVIEWLYCYRVGEKMKHHDTVRKHYRQEPMCKYFE